MKPMTMRNIAILCRSDPELFAQTAAIPKTITPEEILPSAQETTIALCPSRLPGATPP